MKFADFIRQITEAVDPDEEIELNGEKQDPEPAEGPEDAQSGNVDNSGVEAQEDIARLRGLVEQQGQHIEQLTAQINAFIKQGAVVTNETDAAAKQELASANTDLEERARKLEEARKGIYSLNLGKDED